MKPLIVKVSIWILAGLLLCPKFLLAEELTPGDEQELLYEELDAVEANSVAGVSPLIFVDGAPGFSLPEKAKPHLWGHARALLPMWPIPVPGAHVYV